MAAELPIIALPIDVHLSEVRRLLRETKCVILQSSPGSGKSTRVPPALLDDVEGKILVLQPRRIAARMVAQRIADELGEPCGQTVGYRVRFEQSVSAATRIELLTEGLFLRQLQQNPLLAGVGCVILDEFHERHIQADIALALVRFLQMRTRPDLSLILMSATLPGPELRAYVPQAGLLSVKTPMHPVRLEYAEGEGCVDAVLKLLNDPACPGHILVFLTGAREIQRLSDDLQAFAAARGFRVFAVHGSMSLAEQRLAFQTTIERKVVLATNIAETSITIDGVTGVVDSGLAKISGFATWSGLPTLATRPISAAACIQRAGRAGRTGPGVARRLFSELDFSRRPSFETPELHRTDLTPLVLELKQMTTLFDGKDAIAALPWFESPDPVRVNEGRLLLRRLEAFDSLDGLTPLGAEMGRLPLHPRLSRIVLAGKTLGCLGNAILAAAALNEQMFPQPERGKWVDFFDHLEVLRREARRSRLGAVVEQLARLMHIPVHECFADLDHEKLTACLFKGYCDRVERVNAPQKNRDDQFVLVLDAQENSYAKGEKVAIRVAVQVAAEVLWDGPEEFLREATEIVWDEARAKVRKVVRLRYGDYLLEERQVDASEAETKPVLARALKESWPKPFDSADDLLQLRGRIGFLEQMNIKIDTPSLAETLPASLLEVLCEGRSSFADVIATPLGEYLDLLLSSEARRLINELAPTHLQLHPKRRVQIHYEQGKPPWIESRIQDFFGLKKTPTICRGQVPLVMHLLAPNGRAEQVTNDLVRFWQQVYPGLRASLGRRYPRQPWPENPETYVRPVGSK